jgi:ribose/xylose/arabinose/galactoside ABC-type transport system permease subunit
LESAETDPELKAGPPAIRGPAGLFGARLSRLVSWTGVGRRHRQAHVRRTLSTFAGVGLVWLVFALSTPYFFSVSNLLQILLQAANLLVVASALTVTLIAAEIDLSLGSVEALAGAVAAITLIRYGVPVPLGIAAALATGAAAGALNGLAVWKLGIPSFIATLAMLGVAQGTAFLMTGGSPVLGFPDSFRPMGIGRIGGFPIAVVLAVTILVVIHVLLTRTQLGRHFFIVGGNAESAALAGINVGRVKMIALTLSGLIASMGGLILAARLNSGDGHNGATDLLPAVAAVVIGGTSLFGGYGSIAGTAAGVLLIVSITNGLIIMNVQEFWQQVVVGNIIIVAMLVDQISKGEGPIIAALRRVGLARLTPRE